MARKRRMSGILDGLGGRDSFATEVGWQEYQELLNKLKMHTIEQAKDGHTIRSAQGHRNIAARESAREVV